MDFVCGGNHICRVWYISVAFRALRQPVQVTRWRMAFFYLWKGVRGADIEG